MQFETARSLSQFHVELHDGVREWDKLQKHKLVNHGNVQTIRSQAAGGGGTAAGGLAKPMVFHWFSLILY